MKKIKATLAIILILCCLLSMTQVVTAAPFRYENESWQLYKLGLFAGASTNSFYPDLGVTLDRQIGVTLLLNFFGKTPEVKKLSNNEINQILSSYTDQSEVLPWARPYMAYAVQTGVVVGTSLTTLGPKKPLDGLAYAAMILRQMGFTVDRNDFIYSIDTLCNKSGLGQTNIKYFNKAQLIKDDAIGMVYAALFAECSNSKTLIADLIDSGIVSMETAISLKLIQYDDFGAISSVGGEYRAPERPAGYQQAYYQIYEALSNAQERIWLIQNVYTDTFKEITDLVNICVRENPEILYYSGLTYRTDGLLTFEYSKSKETIKNHQAVMEKKVDSILNEIIKPGMTAYQKEIAVHDYLINNCEYDYEGLNSNKISDESYTAYGALCLGIAVCEGYAEAAYILLNRSGVESLIITGESRGVGHAWNLVKIGGEYYHLDVTWDDTMQSGSENAIRYYYFNLSDKDIGQDHEWNSANYPVCTADKYHYYFYNNLVVKNKDELINRVIEEVEKGNREITLKVIESDKSSINAAVSVIVNELYLRCIFSYYENHKVVNMSF